MNLTLPTALRGANDPLNKWLNENPLAFGGLACLIGLALAGWGIQELRTGVYRGKYGQQLSGGFGKLAAIVRLVVGIGACLFGLTKLGGG